MVDFFTIATQYQKRGGVIEIYPKFRIIRSTDLMIRGGDFYAVWLEDRGMWSTDEQDVIQLIDSELDKYAKENRKHFNSDIVVKHMWDAESGMIDRWHKYCQKQLKDNYHMLDEKMIFSNMETNKKDYASKKLNYPLEEGDISAYDKLMSTLYSEDERHKIEWAIGSIISGDSKKIQKFMVLYGEAGTGKSTVLNIMQKLFDGYYSAFDAKALGQSNNAFALEAFKNNPLVAIQHDGDLSRIEDNTRLNSLVSHEMMTVNEKFKSTYVSRFKAFLFIGTNKPVKITDAKSGLIRRLIDVSPSGNKLSKREYNSAMKQIDFELGAIAQHCLDVYKAAPNAYDGYVPMSMLGATNDFYNFVLDSYHIFNADDGTTLKAAWEMYKTYCEEARVLYPLGKRMFQEELKNYFWEFKERFSTEDGSRVRSYYKGFRTDRFEEQKQVVDKNEAYVIDFKEQKSLFDDICFNCLAQYASSRELPRRKWNDWTDERGRHYKGVDTKLSDLDTSKLHYVKVPENHIVIDFDIKDDTGKKSFDLNLKEASKWPQTYAELSKSGNGIHLHYIYTGDVSCLSRVYDDNIEIKVFTGNSSLRRKLTKCNNLPIAKLSSGLPLKGAKQMVNFDGVQTEKGIRTQIKQNLDKQVHPATKPSIDFIYKILEDAYESGIKYDVSDMYTSVLAFATKSTNQANYCIKKVGKMHFKSDEPSESVDNKDAPLVFYDVEVFPNLFLVNWKVEGEGKPVVRMINPSSKDIEELMKFRLVGFNCRRYDNHILYGRLIGYDNERLYKLSQKIINPNKKSAGGFFSEAYNVSYTDVYDFSSKKQSLKKFEIELGIHHQELGLPWDEPVPEEMWPKVAEYCDNDVIATEAVFNARKADFIAREILAEIAGMTVNDTTNSLSTKIIFGNNRHPQDQFNYRDLGDMSNGVNSFQITEDLTFFPDDFADPEYTLFDDLGRPIFPGYKYERGVSTYRGEETGEGGEVYSEPGMYGNVALLDIASMHPSSIEAEQLFGPEYTKRFSELKAARIAIKHKDFKQLETLLGGVLVKYTKDESLLDALSYALKIVINSVYGLTSAKFDNPFRDKRNIDNIVAKRGALFMVNLKYEVQRKGFTVAHIKTDSIKIPDATPEIIQFVTDYGKMYGYTFEHEATYDKMCLVNDAVYIARYATLEKCYKLYGKKYVESSPDVCKDNKKHPYDWTATGTQFAIPYVYKTLFSHEPIEFEDMCETKQVKSAIYLRDNDEDDPEFVGRVGLFCPVTKEKGGKRLLREGKDKEGNIKYDAVTGTKDYYWLESEVVKELGKEDDIDRSYYAALVDDAVASISSYGDFEWFASDDQYSKEHNEILPF